MLCTSGQGVRRKQSSYAGMWGPHASQVAVCRDISNKDSVSVADEKV